MCPYCKNEVKQDERQRIFIHEGKKETAHDWCWIAVRTTNEQLWNLLKKINLTRMKGKWAVVDGGKRKFLS